jgi:hypothetical protein
MGDYVARDVEMVGDEARTIEMADDPVSDKFWHKLPVLSHFHPFVAT